MIILLLTPILLLLILTVVFRSNRVFLPLFVKCLGLLVTVAAVTLYISKVSILSQTFSIDYNIYVYLFNLLIPLTTIADIINVGLMFISLGNILFIFRYYQKYRKLLMLLFPLIIALFSINFSKICEIYYIYINTHEPALSVINENLISNVCLLTFFGCMLIPHIFMINSIIKTKLFLKRKKFISSLMLWFYVDIIIVSLLFISDFKHYMFLNITLLKYPKQVTNLNNVSFMYFSLALLFAIVVLVLTLEVYHYFSLFYARNRQDDTVENINNNIMIMLHTYKNAFCAICAYSDQSNSTLFSSPDERLNIIEEISKTYFEQIKDFINKYKSQSRNSPALKLIDIKKCIDSSITSAAIPSSISVTQSYADKSMYTIGDEFQLSEAFICIINNSTEALMSKNSEARISINAGIEDHNIYINFYDNGIGISRKNLHKIFNPLYSSKNNDKNFGLGLNYMKNTINNHNGTVFIKSKENKYTIIQLTLPLAK